MQQYSVTGMSCAACSSRVEKAVAQVPGVESCAVSLLTHSMGVEGSADPQAVIQAVEAAGYGAAPKGAPTDPAAASDPLEDRETPRLKRRLFASLAFLAALMYVSMGHGMWGWPLPRFFDGNAMAAGLTQLLLAAAVLVINQKFFVSGFRSLWHRAPNMDSLVALGSGAAFVYSCAALFAMSARQAAGDLSGAAHYLHELYFESAAMILALITVGKLLEARAKGKTTDALKSLMDLAPRSACVLREGEERRIPAEQVLPGDIFLVRPGESIPVDGLVLEGRSAVNEAALTGESIPADKEAGDRVSAATLNQSGFLRCRATRVGGDTTLSQIIRLVSEAAATKAPIARIADKVSGIFVPTVMAVALVTVLVWSALGKEIGFSLARGISVLVISCPCALGLATPVAIMVGSGLGARKGILFKTAAALEQTGKVSTVALDKTGTVTEGRPRVTDILPAEGHTQQELLTLAAALEAGSEHPLARAIREKAEEETIAAPPAEDFEALPGNGVRARQEAAVLLGGSTRFMRQKLPLSPALEEAALLLSDEGKTPLFFARDRELLGLIAVADTLKPDSPQAVRELQNMGIRVVMLTGDNERSAKAIGAQAGVDEVIAGVLPQGKEQVIRRLQRQGPVAMVGDGINDAPALTRADTGIAIGAGADVALDAADIVLMNSRLTDVPAAIRLSRAVLRNIRENLFWAFFYNCIGIPLAAGLFIPILGWQLSPMFGAAAMSLSSFCVVSNALRLNLFRTHDSRRDHKIRQKHNKTAKEPETMEKTMKIEGMMCMHCEARVKKTLEALDGVAEAKVSHETDSAVVVLSAPVADETLKAAVEAQDYKVLEIR